ncbi:MAG: hypothetical protein ACK56F_27020 [bacterium]
MSHPARQRCPKRRRTLGRTEHQTPRPTTAGRFWRNPNINAEYRPSPHRLFELEKGRGRYDRKLVRVCQFKSISLDFCS